jgi:hypothetical protein
MPWIAPPALIDLGSVCRRHLTDPRHGLFAILEGLEGHVPAGAKLHLFRVMGQALERVKTLTVSRALTQWRPTLRRA